MTDIANLEDGFYWVRKGEFWSIGEFEYGMFTCLHDYPRRPPSYYDEIDPRPIKREDVK